MSLGFEQAGFDVVAALELDPAHAAAHGFNFPWCEVVQTDARTTTGEQLRAAAAKGLDALGRSENEASLIDVVFGGPPCQGFSVGGLMSPEDPRNDLVSHFMRLVAELQPSAFVLENVPAMASRALPNDQVSVPERLRLEMDRRGYDTLPANVLNASWFGVPQDRRRLIVVGIRRPISLPVLPVVQTLARPKSPMSSPRPWERGHNKAPDLPLGPSVRDALGDLPNLDTFSALLSHDEVRLSPEQRLLVSALRSSYASELAGGTRAQSDYSRPRRLAPATLTSSLRTTHSDAVVDRFTSVERGQREPVSRLYRLHEEGVAPTLRAGSAPERGSYSAPRPIHPTHDRVISVREAARLSGFPDWFRFTAAKWHGFRQVGNAVCPPFGRIIAASVREALGYTPVRIDSTVALGDKALLRVASGAGRRPSPRHMPTGTVGYQK